MLAAQLPQAPAKCEARRALVCEDDRRVLIRARRWSIRVDRVEQPRRREREPVSKAQDDEQSRLALAALNAFECRRVDAAAQRELVPREILLNAQPQQVPIERHARRARVERKRPGVDRGAHRIETIRGASRLSTQREADRAPRAWRSSRRSAEPMSQTTRYNPCATAGRMPRSPTDRHRSARPAPPLRAPSRLAPRDCREEWAARRPPGERSGAPAGQ